MGTIVGVYKKTIYRNVYSGYTVFAVETKDENVILNQFGNITCKGYIPQYSIGIPVKLSGEWDKDCFNAYDVCEYSDNKQNTIDYISNKFVKGISTKTATKIVELFGADIFSAIDKKDIVSEIVSKIPRINTETAASFVKKIKKEKVIREAYAYLNKFGAGYEEATNIVNEFYDSWKTNLFNDPYKNGIKIGLSFFACDAIAKNIGNEYTNESRIKSMIYEALLTGKNSGNVYLTQKELYDEIRKLEKQSAYEDIIPRTTLTCVLMKCKFIVMEKGKPNRIFFKSSWNHEVNVCANIHRINSNKIKLDYDESIIENIEKACNIKYAKAQKNAFRILNSTGVKIITGGPGTGKTTTVNGIIKAYKMLNPNKKVKLCAPTGRAAQRISETSGLEATTIHKLIDLKCFDTDVSHKDQNDPIDADFIVVDESSMIDTELMSMFLDAVKTQCLVLFLGDVNQLPSVGAGNVLKDLIKSRTINLYRLDSVFRQGESSPIIENCNRILRKNYNIVERKGFNVIRTASNEEASEIIEKIIENMYCSIDPFNMQVLSPIKKGPCGVNEINNIIQKKVNKNISKLRYGNHEYKCEDKIIMTLNNYEKGYFNGNIGTIKSINGNNIIVNINNEEILLENRDLPNMSLAYAITVHKSQGSEYNHCIIIVPDGCGKILTKNLLFTAISRAKEDVIIINVNESMEKALENNTQEKRNTYLKSRLQGEIPERIISYK